MEIRRVMWRPASFDGGTRFAGIEVSVISLTLRVGVRTGVTVDAEHHDTIVSKTHTNGRAQV